LFNNARHGGGRAAATAVGRYRLKGPHDATGGAQKGGCPYHLRRPFAQPSLDARRDSRAGAGVGMRVEEGGGGGALGVAAAVVEPMR